MLPFHKSASSVSNSKLIATGRLVFQKYNCQSCHQIFGLGGYLGPDLTNVSSRLPEPAIRQLLRFGIKQMPPYALSEEEHESLFAYLRQLDLSGSADPRNFTIQKDGSIHSKIHP